MYIANSGVDWPLVYLTSMLVLRKLAASQPQNLRYTFAILLQVILDRVEELRLKCILVRMHMIYEERWKLKVQRLLLQVLLLGRLHQN
jgi:hypothetical protein